MSDHPRNAKLNTELARPIGIVDGTSVGGTRRPRTYQKSSPCLVTRADGSQYVIASKQAKQKIARRTFVSHNAPAHRITAADLKPLFAD